MTLLNGVSKYIQNIGLKTLGVDNIVVFGVTGLTKLKADVKRDLKVRSALSTVISLPQ